jgi:hypothetical protein
MRSILGCREDEVELPQDADMLISTDQMFCMHVL